VVQSRAPSQHFYYMSDEMSLEDESTKTPLSQEEKEKQEKLQKKLEAATNKLTEAQRDKIEKDKQDAVNAAVKEVAAKNGELRNKVIELERQIVGLNEKLGAAQLSLSQMDSKYEKLKNNKSSLSQDEILDLLYETSLNDRQKKLLAKYQEGLKQFEDTLGTDKFNEALFNYMVQKIEQKLVAMKENKPKK
jgi:chromosome segregation ATPase